MDERRDAAVHGRRRDVRLQPLLLDTARVLLLLGVATIFSAGYDDPAASATQAFVGLLLWLLGVSLVLVPVAAGRFLHAALVVAAAVVVAVLKHLLALCN